MTGRRAQGWRGVIFGAVMIVVGVVLLAKNVPVLGVSALPVLCAGIVPLLRGVYLLFKADRDFPGKQKVRGGQPQ
jgi:uncharacterized membrane protein HdeD (DUF308 family)